jgi:hypothetical protein
MNKLYEIQGNRSNGGKRAVDIQNLGSGSEMS